MDWNSEWNDVELTQAMDEVIAREIQQEEYAAEDDPKDTDYQPRASSSKKAAPAPVAKKSRGARKTFAELKKSAGCRLAKSPLGKVFSEYTFQGARPNLT